jgi:hypothetical protein
MSAAYLSGDEGRTSMAARRARYEAIWSAATK